MNPRLPARCAFGLLGLLCLLQLVSVLRAAPAHYPARIQITLAPGQSIELGRRELAAPQADLRQLALRRAGDGSWWLRNLRPARPLVLGKPWSDGAALQHTAHSVPRPGQRIQIGQTAFLVDAASAAEVTFSDARQQWRYDGARLWRDGALQPACPDTGTGARWQAGWNRWAPRLLALERPLAFGGNLHCGNRIGIPYTEPGSALLRATPSALALSSTMTILVDGADPALAETPLARFETLGIGRSRFALRLRSGTLELHPQREVALFEEASMPLPAQVGWDWTRRALWSLPGAAGAGALLLACAALLAARRYPGAIPAAIALAGVAALLMGRTGAPPGIGMSMLLGWSALWCFALIRRPLGLAGMAGVLLLGAGLLIQLELALGAPSSIWARHVHKTCALLAIGLGVGAAFRLRPPVLAGRRNIEVALAAIAAVALGALALQVLLGDETGVFALQPVELAKLALTVLTAHCIAVGLGWGRARPETQGAAMRWVRLGAPALLLAALFGLALVGVNDYSPLLLLLLWCAAMALAWALATGRRLLAGALLGACVCAAGAIHALGGADPGQLAHYGFYPDRFEVWLDPAAHPHTGQQMLLAGRAIGAGGWWGADGAFGLSTLGSQAGSVLAIPALQDDFAPTFFVNRHGLIAALALWLLQALFLAGLVRTAMAAYQRAEAARDFRLVWLGRFQCFTLIGGAAFVFGHLLLSWGTNLAILPIMGQPMSFLSAGGSHLLFFICPLLTFAADASLDARVPQPTDYPRRAHHAGLRPT